MFNSLFKKSANILNLKQNSILSASMVIMLAVLLSAFLGFIRIRLLSNFFGDSRILDIFWASFRLPDMLFQVLVMGTLSSAFIPVFSSYLGKGKLKEAFAITNSVITFSLLLFIALSILIIIFTMPLSKILAPGFQPEEIRIMVNLTRIMFIGQIFFLLGNFFTGILQSFNHFLLPALAPVVYNLGIIIGTLLLSPLIGIYGPTFGVVLGAFLFLLLHLPLILKKGFRFKPSLDYQNSGVREIGRLMVPRTISFSISQIEYSADLMIASLLSAGHYTIFNFALFLISLPVRLFGSTIGQATLPTLSLNFAQDNLSEFQKTLATSFRQIMYLVLPASIILLVLRIPLVRLAFGSKSFSWEATLLTGKMVGFLTIAVISQSLTQLLIRAYYALHNTKTPLVIGTISVILNVIFSLVFSLFYGLGILGLALSTSASSLFNMLVLFILINKKTNFIDYQQKISLLKIFLVNFIFALLIFSFQRIFDLFVFDTTKTINLTLLTGITLILGSASYISLSKLLQVQEVDEYLSIFKRFKNIKQILNTDKQLITETSQAAQTQNI